MCVLICLSVCLFVCLFLLFHSISFLRAVQKRINKLTQWQDVSLMSVAIMRDFPTQSLSKKHHRSDKAKSQKLRVNSCIFEIWMDQCKRASEEKMTTKSYAFYTHLFEIYDKILWMCSEYFELYHIGITDVVVAVFLVSSRFHFDRVPFTTVTHKHT